MCVHVSTCVCQESRLPTCSFHMGALLSTADVRCRLPLKCTSTNPLKQLLLLPLPPASFDLKAAPVGSSLLPSSKAPAAG